MQTYLWRLMRRFGALGLFLTSLFALSGCGGGSGDTPASSTGEVVIGLTDAEGDFLTYAVDVKQLTLTKANGAVVNVLPQATRVDFAQYTELTEFFTAATVPAGQYTKATLTLDYSNADIQVEVGGIAKAAVAKDGNGNSIGITEVQVTLENANPLVVAPGIPAHLTLDFDLESSHRVDIAATPAQVTLNPILIADVKLEDPKPHRMRGLLAGVDQNAGRIDLNLRPFYTPGNVAFGQLGAYVNDQTVYEIDGQGYTGSAGLVALANETTNSWVVVHGAINTVTKRFEASEVYGGSSVPGSQYDMVTGVVMARSGDILTVNAGSIVKPDGTLIFNKDITVDVSALTKVTRQLSKDIFGKNDISVGQRLMLLGTWNPNNNSLDNPALARMLISQISGSVQTSSGNTLTLTLHYLNGRPAGRFDFTGTGASAASYEVGTTGLTLNGVATTGNAVRVRGFVTPFGTPSPDFTAQTVIGLANLPATLESVWLPASASAVTVPGTNQLDLNLAGSVLHKVWQGGIVIDALDGAPSPAILANSQDKGLFAINDGGAVYVYHSFSAFAGSLQTRLAGGEKVRRVVARGSYDSSNHNLTARFTSVVLP